MKHSKRIISLLLSALLLTAVLTAAPFTAAAAEADAGEAVGVQAVNSVNCFLFAPRTDTAPSYCATYSDGVEAYYGNDNAAFNNGIAWYDDTEGLWVPANSEYKFAANHKYIVWIASQAAEGYEFGDTITYASINYNACTDAYFNTGSDGIRALYVSYEFEQTGGSGENGFSTQPASKTGYPYATTSFWVNCGSSEDYFYVYRNGKYYSQVEITNRDARGFNVILPCFDGEYRIRYYYYGNDYIESDSFTIDNGCSFTSQPQNKTGTPETTTTFFLNFDSAQDYFYVYLDGEYYKLVTIENRTARGYNVTLPYSDGQYTIRCYYFTDEYIESEPFTISNGCKFNSQPQSRTGYPNATVNFYVNVKSSRDYYTILRGGEYYDVKQIDPNAYYYNAELPSSDSAYTIRFYVYNDQYIESDPFYITNGCDFFYQPEDKTGYPNADVTFSTNFNSAKNNYEVYYNGGYYTSVPIDDTTVRSFKVNLPAADEAYTVRVYYSNKEYIESDPFHVNNGCNFLSQPKDAVSTTEARISFSVNFSSSKDHYDVYLDGSLYRSEQIADTGARNYNLYLPSQKGQYTVRFYYNNRDYIESEPFTVREKAALLGDANDDGIVSIGDTTAIQRHAADIEQIPDYQLKFADVNKDGNVDANDALLVQKYIAKFEVEEFK